MEINRREFARVAGAAVIFGAIILTVRAPLLASPQYPDSPQDKPKDPSVDGKVEQVEHWMDDWMKPGSRSVKGSLHLGRFVEPMWFLLDPISWTPNPGQENVRPVTAPVGFVSDLASIPRIFWSLLPPDGEYAYAAILHDFLYWSQTRTREESDEVLKFCMQDLGVSKVSISAIYEAVRHFGQASWDDNRQRRRGGERRVLKIPPDVPTTRWEKWKDKPGVFTDL